MHKVGSRGLELEGGKSGKHLATLCTLVGARGAPLCGVPPAHVPLSPLPPHPPRHLQPAPGRGVRGRRGIARQPQARKILDGLYLLQENELLVRPGLGDKGCVDFECLVPKRNLSVGTDSGGIQNVPIKTLCINKDANSLTSRAQSQGLLRAQGRVVAAGRRGGSC